MRRHLPIVALVLLAALSGAPRAHAAETRAAVLTSDFFSGCLSLVDLQTLALSDCVNGTAGDARLRDLAGQFVVINRFGGDNVQLVNPTTGATIRQFSVGNGSNPADVAWLGAHRIYVTRYASTTLWIGDPATGTQTGSIDLSAFADADGIPEMDHMAQVGPYVFVALQRLDETQQFAPTDTSLVAVIDSRTDTVVDCDPALPGVQAIVLPRQNPYTDFAFDRATSRLLIGCVGAFGVADGGIVAIDAAGLRPLGTVISEATLGGDVNDLVWRSPSRSFAIVSTPAFEQQLVAWSESGVVSAPLFAPGGFTLADAALDDRDRLWVCHNDPATPGLRLFRAADGVALASPATPALPPVAVAFDLDETPVATAPAGAVATPGLLPATPNPARQWVEFAGRRPGAGPVGIEVLDVAGRRVASHRLASAPDGSWRWRWGLRGSPGTRVTGGLYLLRARAGEWSATGRVLVLD